MKQIIFVVETNASNQSDDRYIKKLIINRYNLINNDVKLQFIHMNGKFNYSNKSVLTQINKLIKYNINNENFVIYCFDTDKINTNFVDLKKFNEEKLYCNNKNFKFIWFNCDIEYVLLNKSVESSKKKKESIKFFNNEKSVIPIKNLFCSNEQLKGYSNFYLILDEILNKYKKCNK